jgi:hypothetical protein
MGWRTKGLANLFETTILRSKIPSPLVNAVGLVDDKECGTKRPELLLLIGALNKETLWGYVEQLEMIARQQPVPKALLVWADITVDVAGWNFASQQRGDLLAHECFQGGDDHTDPSPQNCRHVEAQCLAKARRADDQ